MAAPPFVSDCHHDSTESGESQGCFWLLPGFRLLLTQRRDCDPERLSDPALASGFSFVQMAAAMRTGNAAPGPNG